MHSLEIQTRFGDYDMFGHVNNNSYLQYCDLGKAMYFEMLLGGDAYNPVKIGSVIVNINCDFLAPTRPGEPLQVNTECSRLGDRSFQLSQTVLNPETNEEKCHLTTVMAGFDIKTQTSAPLPDALRQALQATLAE